MSYEAFNNVEDVKNLEKLMGDVNNMRREVSHFIKDPKIAADVDSKLRKVYDIADKEKWKNYKKKK